MVYTNVTNVPKELQGTNAVNMTSHLISLNLFIPKMLTRLVWTVQPSQESSYHSGLIDDIIREIRSPQHITHFPYMWNLCLIRTKSSWHFPDEGIDYKSIK